MPAFWRVKLQYLVGVVSEVEAAAPVEILRLYVRGAQFQLVALVPQLADVREVAG